jgi:hypothetical protein
MTIDEEKPDVVTDEVDQGGDNPAVEEPAKESIVVSIGDEPADEPAEVEQPAPAWVKKVRHRNRELEKELREARQKLQEVTKPKEQPAVGTKPTLADHDYDTDRYEAALTSWYDRKRKADEQAAAARAEAEKADKDWQARLAAYNESKAAFKADDFDEAEAVATELLDQTQQGIIVHGAIDPTLLVYALGKNEAKAKELAAIKDPVKFAFAVAKLEAVLKVTTRKPATQPESRISGNGRPSGTIDHTLDRLREEAAKTGDYTKVTAYKRSKRS